MAMNITISGSRVFEGASKRGYQDFLKHLEYLLSRHLHILHMI